MQLTRSRHVSDSALGSCSLARKRENAGGPRLLARDQNLRETGGPVVLQPQAAHDSIIRLYEESGRPTETEAWRHRSLTDP